MLSPVVIKNKIETQKAIKITTLKKENLTMSPHKHSNYIKILYLSKGSGYHYIDLVKFPIEPPVIYFIRQEQVHHWKLETEPEGYVIIIKKAFIERTIDNELKSLLVKISGQCCLQLTTNTTIEKLFQLLTEENKTEGESAFHITEGLLKSLLSKVLQVSQAVINKTEFKHGLYHSFIELLITDGNVKNKVSFYAAKLNTSPQNLNTVCRKASNQTAADTLCDFIISEAKRLLLYTDNTISEVCFALGFKDSSHFVKYFKKSVGATPQSFRSING